MSDDIRDIILGSIKYDTVIFPDAGEINMLPYVSGKAMDVMTSDFSDSRKQFKEFYGASVQEESCSFTDLSENDIEEIAKYYCTKQDCLSAFDEARQQDDIYKAFQRAFCSTEAWEQAQKHRQRIIQQIQLSSKVYLSGIQSEINNSIKLVQKIDRYGGLLSNSLDTVGWINQRRQLLEVSVAQLNPTLMAVKQVNQTIERSFTNWSSLALNIPQSRDLQSMIRTRSNDLGLMVRHSQDVSQILLNVSPLQESINKMLALTRESRWDFDELGVAADKAIGISAYIAKLANRHFYGLAQERELGQPVYPDNSSELIEADELIEDMYKQSQCDLHEDASETVVLTNDTLILIKEQCGEALEEHLAPYSTVLQRLEYLAKPESFIQVLRQFGQNFGNQHWKSLWEKFGDKYKPRPEQIAQSMLSLFVEGKCGDIAFVGRELGSGNGYIDLLVSFLGYNYIVEIKIVGAGWGIGAAQDGLGQLDAYMATYAHSRCFLVVFDGRKTNSGGQLEDSYPLTNGSVEVVVVKSYYDSPTN